MASLNDLVGLRVVVLYLSDMPELVVAVRNAFDVVMEDDKVTAVGNEDALWLHVSHHLVDAAQVPLRRCRKTMG